MLAAHHLRLFALIVDYMAIVVGVKLLQQLFMGDQWDLAPSGTTGETLPVGWLALLVLGVLVRDMPNGSSIGKWMSGIQVAKLIRMDRPPPLGMLALRNLAMVLLPLEAVLVFTDPYYRRLGDRLAGTVVIASPRPSPPARRLLVLAILFLGSLLVAFLLTAWNLRRSAAFQTGEAAALADPQVRQTLGNSPDFTFSPVMQMGREGDRLVARLTLEGEDAGGVTYRVRVEMVRTRHDEPWDPREIRVEPKPE